MLSALVFILSIAGAAQTAPHQVVMKSISFDPKSLSIKAGDEVEWINRSYTEHSATASDGKQFDTGLVKPNATSKKIKFDKPGSYTYNCSIHGKTMSGQIIVEAGAQ